MKLLKTKIDGAFIIELERSEDERGFFSNVWDKKIFQKNNLNADITELNIAHNKKKGTIRGLHYQSTPYEGTKLVRCTVGRIWDVVLDLRPNSKTFKEWYSVELRHDNYKANYVPEGCAHGYQTLEDNSEVFYLNSQVYNLNFEKGVNYADPAFNISFPLDVTEISKKDSSWPLFDFAEHQRAISNFPQGTLRKKIKLLNKKEIDFTKKLIQKHLSAKKTYHNDIKKIRVSMADPPYDWEEVYEALDSMLEIETTMGNKVQSFEKLFAKYIGVKYAVMVNSGSSANLLALSILSNPLLGKKQIKTNEEVITPAVTWSTTVFPIVNVKAKPVFVDVESETFNIDPQKIEKAITKKTRAIMPVHLLGNPCNMKIIKKIARKHDLFLIEDCCEALGAKFEGKKVGAFGDLATFSFFASHHITTMEGGMLVTNNQKLFDIAKSIRAHGWSRDLKNKKTLEKKYSKIDSRFLFSNLGYNLRPTELQGAFGIHQIKKIDKFLKIRATNAKFWKKKLAGYYDYLKFVDEKSGNYNANMLFPIKVVKNNFFTKDELVNYLQKNGIETRPVVAGNFVKQPVINLIPHKISGSLKNSTEIMENAFLIGIHQNVDESKRKYVSEIIIKFLKSKIKL